MYKNKKKTGSKKWIVGIAIIIAFIFIWTIFFNGRGLYFTWGMSSSTVVKADSVAISDMGAKILITDEKDDITELSDNSVISSEVNSESIASYVKNSAKNQVARIALLNLMAKQKGVVLSHSEQNACDLAASNYFQNLTDEERAYLSASKAKTETFFKQYAIAQKMYQQLIADNHIEVSTDDARVISIQYIVTDNREIIDNAKSLVDSGTPFYKVAEDVNGGGNSTAELTKGMTEKSFEEAAFSLESGKVSDIVESNGKYYLIKCSSDNQQSKTDANKEKMLATKKDEYFLSKFAPFENSHYVQMNNGLWKKIQVADAKAIGQKFEEVFRQNVKL